MDGAAIEAAGRTFVDAHNRRDFEALCALTDPEIAFHPTSLTGGERIYRGHEGLRRWVDHLHESKIVHRAQIRELRVLDENRLMILTNVLVDGELVTEAAMLTRLTDDGAIAEIHAYLSDEEMLKQVGLLPSGEAHP